VVGVERKRIRDLLNSMESGRLAGHQLRGMFAAYEHVYLLVEGIYRPGTDGVLEEMVGSTAGAAHGHAWRTVRLRGSKAYMYRDVDNYLNSLSTTAPIRVKRSSNLAESAHILSDLYWFWSKEWADHSSLKVIYDAPPPTALLFTPTLVRRVANQLPGIGWERSGAVSHKFTSVIEMVEASVSRWAEIPGIGKGIAAKVYQALRGQPEPADLRRANLGTGGGV
jgi:ERCC4-type nuclease